MNKEDLKKVGAVLLCILYIVFGVSCAYATVVVTKETGLGGFLTGSAMTLLMFIPVWYICRDIINIKDFFD